MFTIRLLRANRLQVSPNRVLTGFLNDPLVPVMQSSSTKVIVLKKTPEAARYLRQLIRVNDQVCFAALGQWEFEQALIPLVKNNASDFTPTALPSNPFAGKLNRKIADLPSFSRESEQVALRMGVIAGLEYCLAYLKDVQVFRHSLSPSPSDSLTNDAEEEQLHLKILQWSGKEPVQWYFRTLGYLRLLRNHYAHMNDEPASVFQSYVRSYGSPLNKFWDNGATEIHGINFNNLADMVLTPKLTFGVMNLMRICIQHIDDMVASTLSLDHAVTHIIRDILRHPKNRQLKAKRLVSKVRARLESEWNIKEGLVVVTNEVERVVGTAD